MCLGCLKNNVKCRLEVKCPTCRIVATEYTTVSTRKSSTLIRPARAAAAAGAEAAERVEYDVDYIAGIKSTEDREVFYLVVWKTTGQQAAAAGPGAPQATWEPSTFFNDRVNIDDFHKRFNIPLVSDAGFPYPYRKEHGLPLTVISADGEISYKCSKCPLFENAKKRCNIFARFTRKESRSSGVFRAKNRTPPSSACRAKNIRSHTPRISPNTGEN